MRNLALVLGCMVCLLLIAGTDQVIATVADGVVSSGLTRSTSSPPVRPVADLAFDSTVEQQLNWTMYLNGDYDQNGEVNISDVTVIGQNFGATSSHLNWDKARVADGDGNGEVNIADITPIGNNFGSRITHFRLYSSTSETGPFEIASPTQPDSHTTIMLDSAPIPPGGGPRLFSHAITYPHVGKYYTVVAYDGEESSIVHSNVVLFDPENEPPLAGMAVDYSGIPRMVGGFVTMTDLNSSDSDGTIVSFEWDPLGNGQFINTGTVDFLEYQYNEPGEYTPVLRVTDDGGATSTTSYPTPQEIIVEGITHTQVVDDALSSGVNLSCANVAGVPAIAYCRNLPSLEMYYVVSDGGADLDWSSPVMVDTVASMPSLEDIGGYPAIAYAKNELNYIRASAADGSAWALPALTLEDSSDTISRGHFPKLLQLAGLPLVADGDWSLLEPGNVYVSPVVDVEGSGWWGYMTMNDPGTTALKPSLALFDGEFAGLAFEKVESLTARSIEFMRADHSSPPDLWYENYPVAGANARLSADKSLVAAHGLLGSYELPLVAFWDVDSATLRSRTGDAYDGNVWKDVVDIAQAGNTDGNFSMIRIGEQPAVVFTDRTTNELKLSWAADRLASAWGPPLVIDSGAEFRVPSLIEYNQLPAVAYYDADAQVLKFTYFTLE